MHEGGARGGSYNGAFLQQFETLPQPLPELRQGGYIVFLFRMLSGYSKRFPRL
jgi:hypothetical protein